MISDSKNYLRQALSSEEASMVAKPMDRACRAAVLIPVYHENIDTVLRPLVSLARQENVKPADFEVVVIVNNTRSEAENKTESFCANQKAIELARSLEQGGVPGWLNRRQAAWAKEVLNFGLKIFAIDKSSVPLSHPDNNIGYARNRAGAEICHRFLRYSEAGGHGVVAVTDCDCRFSPNFIAELLGTFSLDDSINAVSGKSLVELDPDLPFREFFDNFLGINSSQEEWERLLEKRQDLIFEKKSRLTHHLIKNGHNMSVRVRAWIEAGGVDLLPFLEDVHFGKKVSMFPGEIVKNLNYQVWTLIRASRRIPHASFGARISNVLESIQAYRLKRAKRIVIDQIDMTKELANLLHV